MHTSHSLKAGVLVTGVPRPPCAHHTPLSEPPPTHPPIPLPQHSTSGRARRGGESSLGEGGRELTRRRSAGRGGRGGARAQRAVYRIAREDPSVLQVRDRGAGPGTNPSQPPVEPAPIAAARAPRSPFRDAPVSQPCIYPFTRPPTEGRSSSSAHTIRCPPPPPPTHPRPSHSAREGRSSRPSATVRSQRAASRSDAHCHAIRGRAAQPRGPRSRQRAAGREGLYPSAPASPARPSRVPVAAAAAPASLEAPPPR